MTNTTQAGHVFRPQKTKKSQLIRMLSTRTGSDIGTISRKLGWQSHTTRAAITGLRKAGYEVTAEKSEDGKPTRYRISAAPAPAGDTAGSAAARETVDAGES